MSMKHALYTVLGVGVFGLLFSGYLSYRELFAAQPAASCPSLGPTGTIFGYPPCVYGLLMYAVIVVAATVGLVGGRGRVAIPVHRIAESS